MRVCDVCGAEAKYIVGIDVRVIDLQTGRERIKALTVTLCEEHEANSRLFLQRDVGQRRRVAGALSPRVQRRRIVAMVGERR